MAKDTLKDKSVADLTKMIGEKREELRKVRFEAAGARPKDSNSPSKIRKVIARISTELSTRTKVAK